MASPRFLDNPADPRLTEYQGLIDRQLAALRLGQADGMGNGLFMAEGELVVRQLAASGLPIRSVLMSKARLETMGDLVAALPDSIPVYVLEQHAMNEIVGFDIHRGVLAAGVRPLARDPQTMVAGRSMVAVLENTANHDNMGGVFRALGALAGLDRAAVLLLPGCCDPLYRKAIRVSMGTALRIPFATVDQWPEGLAMLRARGFSILALSGSGGVPLPQVRPAERVAILIGAEGPGLSEGAMSMADHRVRIPMRPGVDSLNLVTAAAIALYHLISAE